MAAGEIHVPLWVDYGDDDKIIDAGEKAELLFIRGLCFMKRNKTDGFISDRQLARIMLPGAKARAARLVEVGLWERVTDGYYCPSFLKRNKSRSEIDETSEHRTAAALAANHRRWHSETRSDSCPLCDPLCDPESDRSTESSSQSQVKSETMTDGLIPFEAEFNALWAHYPNKLARLDALKAYQARRRAGVPAEEFMTALGHFVPAMSERTRDKIMHGSTFFGPNERWKDYLAPVATSSNGNAWDPDAWSRSGS